MIKVHSKALDTYLEIDRIVGHIKGEKSGPTLIFIAGMHGNEPLGVFALHSVLDELNNQDIPIAGNIYAIAGNLWALEKGLRYKSQDLNRMWTTNQLDSLLKGTDGNQEFKEQKDLYRIIRKILDTEEGPFYFMDLHTTSSESVPFLPVSDSLLNRKFTEQYPVPMILGIEEYIEGPLLSYINELGYVAFGFEGGQHNDLASFENHKAFIYLTLAFAESVSKNHIDYYHYHEQLAKTSVDSKDIYEIYFRFEIKEDDNFTMKPGFVNFQHLHSGQEVATLNEKPVVASVPGRIFLPLYQNQGKEGFFAIRGITRFALRLSAILRKTRFDRILPILPGITWESEKRDALIVNRKVARLFAKQFFHLIGYRAMKVDKTHLIIKNREAASRESEYDNTEWWS